MMLHEQKVGGAGQDGFGAGWQVGLGEAYDGLGAEQGGFGEEQEGLGAEQDGFGEEQDGLGAEQEGLGDV